jgi:chromosome segregation ATPase
MAQQPEKLDKDSKTTHGQDNLVTMQTGNKEKKVLEINKQMSSLESSLENLNKKLNSTNRQIKTDVERLISSDADISEKVAETYKQLGDIDSTFQELNEQSSQINTELKKVNGTIKALEKSTSLSLNEAIESQSSINDEFKQVHTDLIERAEKLSKKARTISKKLDKSIQENSQALTDLEGRIVNELKTVAESSQERDNKLDDKITSANEAISSQKAKILIMQSVDEALDKRALALEKTSQLLIKDSEELRDSTEVLDVLTAKLSSDVEALEIHTASLQQQTDTLGRSLLSLATLEKKHFRVLGSASIVLLLAIVALYFYGEYVADTEATVEASRNDVVNENISELQNNVADEQMASKIFYQEINGLEQSIDQIKTEMKDMNDQVESIDGRVQYINPSYNFGSDNTIHGSQWLSKLDPNLQSIKLGTVAGKQDLYELASRYNRYLTEDLAYFVTDDKQFTLVYGGKFENDQQLESVMRRMPRFMNDQLITSISNADILKRIGQ